MDKKNTLLFASSNVHKVEEVRPLLPSTYQLLGLRDIHWTSEIPEPFDTFEENAKAKVSLIFNTSGYPCFADDSGLEVDALDGRPGVFSARYAGEQKNSSDNVAKVLAELASEPMRTARFIAVIAYQYTTTDMYVFKGTVEGSIGFHPTGSGGFGYDPVFIPSGFDRSFGVLSPLVKNLISHRATAMRKFIKFLGNVRT
jgi:XTP/dITP diphosphohydrolase